MQIVLSRRNTVHRVISGGRQVSCKPVNGMRMPAQSHPHKWLRGAPSGPAMYSRHMPLVRARAIRSIAIQKTNCVFRQGVGCSPHQPISSATGTINHGQFVRGPALKQRAPVTSSPTHSAYKMCCALLAYSSICEKLMAAVGCAGVWVWYS